MMYTSHREPRNGNRAEPSAHRFLAECSDKRPSAQYLRPNLQPIYQFVKQPPWERASLCSREPQVAGQNVVSAARYLVARNSLPPDRCKVAWERVSDR